mmetsp:Transcript_58428/g.136560  ORF Transcript_58428/g.136560 Transcript_58428/m.136560 type:complete len:255 (-) Transcript_58428:925-1689(-)
MIAIRSPKMSASSMKCVVSTVTRPSRMLRIMFQVERRLKGSMPEVGSSRKHTRGWPMIAKQRDNFRRCPPESEDARVFIFSVSPTSSIICCMRPGTSLRCTPRRRQYMRRCSPTVRSCHKTSCCGQTPMILRMLAIPVHMEKPAMLASPLVGAIMPVSILMVVVFPAPLWPSSARICPEYIDKFKSATATLVPPGVLNTLRRACKRTKQPLASELALTAAGTASMVWLSSLLETVVSSAPLVHGSCTNPESLRQ